MLPTCKTVTGIRTPWSFQSAVIPRLRAIRPVRIEFGLHFEEFASSELFAVEELLAAFVLAVEMVRNRVR